MRNVVQIIDTGVANVRSIQVALRRLSFESNISRDSNLIANAKHVILPGVGSFGTGMAGLHESGLAETIQQRVECGRPLFAVCLGMQLLCLESEESPDVLGLGLLPAKVQRFDTSVQVPQLGWNEVAAEPESDFSKEFPPGVAYFANSFRIADCPPDWDCAYTDYGGRFVSAVRRGNCLACQFHPELSGEWGQAWIGKWLVSTC